MTAVYTYDFADRPASLLARRTGRPDQPLVAGAGYLPSGPLASLTLGNGLAETRGFDDRDFPSSIALTGISRLLDWAYSTDAVGNILSITDTLTPAASRTYGYQDFHYFLTRGDGPWGPRAWTYDKIGNRLTETRGAVADTYSYLPSSTGGRSPILSQIQLGAGGTRTYQFGPAGHLEKVTLGADSTVYRSDAAGRLSALESPGAGATFRYDGRDYLTQAEAGTLPFQDGFESGDLHRWTETPPAVRPTYSSEGLLHALQRNTAPERSLVFSFAGRPVAQLDLSGGTESWTFLTTVAAFSPNGRTLATGSTRDNIARLWDAIPGKNLEPLFHDQSYLQTVAFSPDGRVVVTISDFSTVRLWNARTRKSIELPLQHHQSFITAVALSPDGKTLATASLIAKIGSFIRLWDARTGKPLGHPLQDDAPVTAMTFSPDGRALATGSTGIRLWNTRTGKPVGQPLLHEDWISTLAFSPDGRTLASGSGGDLSTVELWDVQSSQPLASLEIGGSATVIAFSSDGRNLAVGSDNNYVQLWDTESMKLLIPSLPLQGSPQTIAFMQNGSGFFVATDHWLNTYSWDGKNAVPQSVQLLNGFWSQSYRFPPDCKRCLQVALGDTGNSFHLETLHLDDPIDPPIEGDAKELLEKWEHRLGLKFDEQMRPVPR